MPSCDGAFIYTRTNLSISGVATFCCGDQSRTPRGDRRYLAAGAWISGDRPATGYLRSLRTQARLNRALMICLLRAVGFVQ